MARNAPFGRRAGARVRGEASAGAGAHGARCWAGRGGSAQQPRQPHAELAEESEPRAPGGRSARRPAVREGRGEPRGGESVSAVTAVATAPVARARPRRRWAGSREGRRRGAWRRPRCPSVARRCGAEPGERGAGGQEAAARAGRPGRGAASPVPGRSQPPAGKPEGAAAFRAARSRWQDGASPSHALLELIPLFCFPCPPSLSQKAARACVQLPNNSVSCERVPETLLCNASPTFTGEETETQVASGTYPCQTMVPKYE